MSNNSKWERGKGEFAEIGASAPLDKDVPVTLLI